MGGHGADVFVNIHALDSAYKRFPSFEDWASGTTVDSERWTRYNQGLKERGEQLPAGLKKALNVAKRTAAIDTGAIEGLYDVDRGFTYSVAVEAAAWEASMAAKGKDVRPLFEAQLHAYDFVLDLATRAEPISEAAIRALHVEICKAQATYRVVTAIGPQEQELPKGQYKVLPNHVRTRKGTDHSYAPVDVTGSEMARLTRELRSDEFMAAHPVLQAAYAHYCFVVIHPFADGNGRVARALASAFTYRAASIPIVILSDQKSSYLDSLEKADAGDYQAFVDFMLARALDTVSLVEESLLLAGTPDLKDTLASIEQLYIAKGGLAYEQVDELGSKLINAVYSAITRATAQASSQKVSYGGGVSKGGNVIQQVSAEHRLPLSGPLIMNIVAGTQPPAHAGASRVYTLLVPRSATGADDIMLVNQTKPSDRFRARIDELMPVMSEALAIRVEIFAERVLQGILADLSVNAQKTVGKLR
jgi:Fic family protein